MSVPRSRKLFEELQVVFEEQAQVIDAIAQHGEAIYPHAEGIALPTLAIDPRSVQHVWMNHPAAQDLQPAGLLANAASLAVAEHTLDMCYGKGCRVCKQTGWLEILGCG